MASSFVPSSWLRDHYTIPSFSTGWITQTPPSATRLEQCYPTAMIIISSRVQSASRMAASIASSWSAPQSTAASYWACRLGVRASNSRRAFRTFGLLASPNAVIVVMPPLYFPEFSDGACQPATIPADHASRLRASAHDEERASNCPSTVLGLWQAGPLESVPVMPLRPYGRPGLIPSHHHHRHTTARRSSPHSGLPAL